ncbi:hypothetical protein ATK23_0549 [Glutamicibacter mysorens]|uniref:Uncharacterized protein n=1 Tax=Glutamicibacter mysorens TaxID=257984 RepID=A0ABX4MVR2_9MICC|nr:hypothetical protein [Glutamicibacter mysorens]PJJ43366.1 hypothetical protein ATK23_0549 [Glutamicibacter mysorens]
MDGRVDAATPDPGIARAEQLKLMPVPVMGLSAQPLVGDAGYLNVQDNYDDHGLCDMSVSVSYTLRKAEVDRSKFLGGLEQCAVEEAVPGSVHQGKLPRWLAEYVRRTNYPQLFEAVRTTWTRDSEAGLTLAAALVDHANYVLINQFRKELGLPEESSVIPPLILTEKTVNGQAEVQIEDSRTAGAEIDTDPYIYAIGAELPSGALMTAVLPRMYLDQLELRFAARPQGSVPAV